MELHPCHPHFFEDEMIENLKSSGLFRRKAEEQLFARYFYLIATGTSKYLISEEDSFDAYSDTVMAAIQSIISDSFKGRSSFKTFFYEIFHNKCIDLLRKKTARKNSVHSTISIGGFENYLSDRSTSIIEDLINKSDFDKVKRKMNQLNNTCRQLLLLSADGYSDKEIAEILNFKTASVVKTSRLRCLKKLRKLLLGKEESLRAV